MGDRIEITALDGKRTVVDTRSLAEAVAEAVDRLKAGYDAQIARGMTYAGKPLQIDPASTANMTSVAALTSKGSSLPADFAWRMSDNTYLPMTAAEQATMAATAAARVMAIRKALWVAVDAARVAKTNDDADAVKASWPRP